MPYRDRYYLITRAPRELKSPSLALIANLTLNMVQTYQTK